MPLLADNHQVVFAPDDHVQAAEQGSSALGRVEGQSGRGQSGPPPHADADRSCPGPVREAVGKGGETLHPGGETGNLLDLGNDQRQGSHTPG